MYIYIHVYVYTYIHIGEFAPPTFNHQSRASVPAIERMAKHHDRSSGCQPLLVDD